MYGKENLSAGGLTRDDFVLKQINALVQYHIHHRCLLDRLHNIVHPTQSSDEEVDVNAVAATGGTRVLPRSRF
jgi:hypothetical protein